MRSDEDSMKDVDRKKLRALGKEAGKYAVENKSRLRIDRRDKYNTSTDIEKDLSEFYESRLRQIIDVPVLTEENSSPKVNSNISEFWLVDSIDGTLSYVNGFLSYVTQFAHICDGVAIYGLVYAPEYDDLYEGIFQFGAFKNGIKIQSDYRSEFTTIVDNTRTPNKIVKSLMDDFGIANYVMSGSIGLKLCLVADGQADLFVKLNSLEAWDVAPAALVLKEAGGFACNVDGSNFINEVGIKTKGILGARNTKKELIEAVQARIQVSYEAE